MMHPYEIKREQERIDAEALEPVAMRAFVAFAAALPGKPARDWGMLSLGERDAWRAVAKDLAGSTPAYRRGASEAYQDRCEGIPARLNVGESPDYIADADRAEFVRGYESIARHHR